MNMEPVTAPRPRVRMYRQGLGDCFLIGLPRDAAGDGLFWVLIDCGVLLGTAEAAGKMTEVARDIEKATGGRIDLLIVTHEHWDHVSGFLQAREVFERIEIGEVWLGWTEDESDPVARRLGEQRLRMLDSLRLQEARLRAADSAGHVELLDDFLQFFGAAGGTTRDALNAVKEMGRKPGSRLRYCRPEDAPVRPEGVKARFWVLGPPSDPAWLKKTLPSRGEGYGIDTLDQAFADGPGARPFSQLWSIPLDEARTMAFFRERYWGPAGQIADFAWRRVDGAWLEPASELALQLDAATNNTSLVIAIELDDPSGAVLLFSGDAQVGNWESWRTLSWPDPEKDVTVTGPDLLARTVLYKVGHHGSHNATPKEDGLERMIRLEAAMLPVDQAMAMRKRWTRMPLPMLVDALTEKTKGRLIRSDEDVGADPKLSSTPLWREYQV